MSEHRTVCGRARHIILQKTVVFICYQEAPETSIRLNTATGRALLQVTALMPCLQTRFEPIAGFASLVSPVPLIPAALGASRSWRISCTWSDLRPPSQAVAEPDACFADVFFPGRDEHLFLLLLPKRQCFNGITEQLCELTIERSACLALYRFPFALYFKLETSAPPGRKARANLPKDTKSSHSGAAAS